MFSSSSISMAKHFGGCLDWWRLSLSEKQQEDNTQCTVVGDMRPLCSRSVDSATANWGKDQEARTDLPWGRGSMLPTVACSRHQWSQQDNTPLREVPGRAGVALAPGAGGPGQLWPGRKRWQDILASLSYGGTRCTTAPQTVVEPTAGSIHVPWTCALAGGLGH